MEYQNVGGNQGVGDRVSGHRIADAPPPKHDESIERPGHRARKPPVAMQRARVATVVITCPWYSYGVIAEHGYFATTAFPLARIPGHAAVMLERLLHL